MLQRVHRRVNSLFPISVSTWVEGLYVRVNYPAKFLGEPENIWRKGFLDPFNQQMYHQAILEHFRIPSAYG